MKNELIIRKTAYTFTGYALVRLTSKKEKFLFKFDNSFLGIKKIAGLINRNKITMDEGVNLMKQIYILPIPIVRCRIYNEYHRVQKTQEYLRKCLDIIKKVEDKIFRQISEVHKLSLN